jgi:hypothetical protein
MTGELDVSHLTELKRIGDRFAGDTSIAGLRLPPSVTFIGDWFIGGCTSVIAALDMSHMVQLLSVGAHFADGCSAAGVLLPPNLMSIGDHFLCDCANISDDCRQALLFQCGGKPFW